MSPRMDKSRPAETDKFRISDYLVATEKELALYPHAPPRPRAEFQDYVDQSGIYDDELMFRSLPRGEDR